MMMKKRKEHTKADDAKVEDEEERRKPRKKMTKMMISKNMTMIVNNNNNNKDDKQISSRRYRQGSHFFLPSSSWPLTKSESYERVNWTWRLLESSRVLWDTPASRRCSSHDLSFFLAPSKLWSKYLVCNLCISLFLGKRTVCAENK